MNILDLVEVACESTVERLFAFLRNTRIMNACRIFPTMFSRACAPFIGYGLYETLITAVASLVLLHSQLLKTNS